MKLFRKISLLLLFLSVVNLQLSGQVLLNPSDTLNKKRLNGFIIGASATYTVALISLNELWYKDFERESFHFFNDNNQWKQVDKVGHFYSSYQISLLSMNAYRWSGLSERKSYFWGSMTGLIMMLPIEILDGLSSEYGASWGDLVANAAGSFTLFGQYLLWKEIRIHPKFSFHQSDYASLRPSLLGSNFQEELIKDYNGQTYWLSFDIYKFLKDDNKFPKWLNVAVGYGADRMVYATDTMNEIEGYSAYRQLYLSIDFDLTHIKTDNGILRTLLYIGNMIKLPAPTLEFNKEQGVKFHPFYF